MHLSRDLQARERAGRPLLVGVIGCGFFGSGVVRQLVRAPGVRAAVVANRTPERAIAALRRAGVAPSDIVRTEQQRVAADAIAAGRAVVTTDLSLPARLDSIEVVSETTGDLEVGAERALEAIAAGKHVVAANPETQATVGPLLAARAAQAGVVYSDMDGDQPGILQRMVEWAELAGFEPVLAGNCKGVMKRYATPETQAAYCRENPIKPWIAVAAADGTKLSFEMCLLANANGMLPARWGMSGVTTTQGTLLADLAAAGVLRRGERLVEYTLGIPVGVFVVGYSEDPWIQGELRYLKMGQGPYYLFFSPHVLCQLEAVPSIAEAALYGAPVIAPRAAAAAAEVASFAKRDLEAGRRLDGIGGFDLYGELVSAADAAAEDLLPIGLAHCARLVRPLGRDEPVRRRDVELVEETVVTRLWTEQAALFGAARPVASSGAG